MKKHLAALACITALALPASAQAAAIIDFGTSTEIAGSNNFKTLLNGLGLTQYASLGSSITLDAASSIRFEFLGTESGYSDTFSTVPGALSYSEATLLQNNFLAPILIGTAAFDSGTLAGLLNFSSAGGDPATIGQKGFGVFLGPNQVSGAAVNTFYFGYDDRITGDDDFDDFIVRATLLSANPHAVPEPGTWGLLLAGFGLAGFALRRRGRHQGLRTIRV